ncbi:MAG TPA: cyclase [Ruminococcus sp.]|nr:cyclase [Ruminococcus sp.]
MIIDISQEVLSCAVYPGDPAPELKAAKRTADGDNYNLSELTMCVHNGTHIDAPFHFLGDGKTVEKMPLDSFVGAAYVCRVPGDISAEKAEEILESARMAGAPERIIIADRGVVTAPAARVFADGGVRLVGTDSQSVGPEQAPMEVHLILLGREIVLLEGLVLDGVTEGKYFLSAAPLNLAGSDGSPCRAYLMTED